MNVVLREKFNFQNVGENVLDSWLPCMGTESGNPKKQKNNGANSSKEQKERQLIPQKPYLMFTVDGAVEVILEPFETDELCRTERVRPTRTANCRRRSGTAHRLLGRVKNPGEQSKQSRNMCLHKSPHFETPVNEFAANNGRRVCSIAPNVVDITARASRMEFRELIVDKFPWGLDVRRYAT